MDCDRKEFLFQVFMIITLLIVSASILIIAYYQSKSYHARSAKENMQEMLHREALDGVP